MKKIQLPPHIPDDWRVYCIGDIHGRADLLLQLHSMIISDAELSKGRRIVVYLGDYIDRGEQSRQVIDLLLEQPLPRFESIFLLGNHEQAMLKFMEQPKEYASWLSFGGRETLNSYGISLAHIPTIGKVVQLAEQFGRNLPDTHRAFFQNCVSDWRCGDYYFVHAGIRPGVALDRQTLEDKLWIRNKFLNSNMNHGAVVVHGHNISTQAELLPNRIGIDTGAFMSGVLTCLVLEGSEQRLVQTVPEHTGE